MNSYQVCKYSYVDDILLIRAATFSESSANSQLTIKESIDVVPLIYRDVPLKELSSFHWQVWAWSFGSVELQILYSAFV